MATILPKNPASNENKWLKAVLLTLMVLVLATGATLMLLVLVQGPPNPAVALPGQTSATGTASASPIPPTPTAPVTAQATLSTGASSATQPSTAATEASTPPQAQAARSSETGAALPGTAPSPPPPGSFGIFDMNQSGSLPLYSRFLIALVIMLTTAVVEIFLIILYAAFFVNDPRNAAYPLGLPQATVRVFLVTIIVLIVLVFGFLPDIWGNNKAVVLLFGLLSTVIGFYFGSRATGDAGGGTPNLRLSLDAASKTQVKGTARPISGSLGSDWEKTLGLPSAPIYAVLLDRTGTQLTGAQAASQADTSGKVEFDFTTVLNAAAQGTYILRIISPSNLTCEDRITLS